MIAEKTNSFEIMQRSNIETFNSMNRKNRRAASKLMNSGRDPEQISQELKRFESISKPSPLLKMWRALIRGLNRKDPYYCHIQKSIRPMVSTFSSKNGQAIMQADYIKCEKIRKKMAKRGV